MLPSMPAAATSGFQALENRTIRSIVALAMLNQLLQGVAQAGQFLDLAVQLGDMGTGQRLDVGAGALAVLPEGQQLADFLQRKTQVTGALDKGQAVQVSGVVAAVTIVATPGRHQQADGFVVTDHLGGKTALFGCLTDVHGSTPSVSRFSAAARCSPR